MRYFECGSGMILFGDVLAEMRTLPAGSVDCIITSPPYWQQRDYGFDGQWGLEADYHDYLDKMWSLMDECWRVLKKGGTVFINLKDTYAKHGYSGGNKKYKNSKILRSVSGLRRKTMCMIPQRFAIGCLDRRWILRNDIIWVKPNGKPESAQDRFTYKHELIYFFVKRPVYRFDLNSVKIPWKRASIERRKRAVSDKHKYATYGDGLCAPRTKIAKESAESFGSPRARIYRDNHKPNIEENRMGNPGDCWIISTKPTSRKHTAAYNPDVIEMPLKAGCPEGGVVLDPFCGSGTTLLRAEELGRRWIGIDGSEISCEESKERIMNELSKGKQLELNYG